MDLLFINGYCFDILWFGISEIRKIFGLSLGLGGLLWIVNLLLVFDSDLLIFLVFWLERGCVSLLFWGLKWWWLIGDYGLLIIYGGDDD